MSQNATHERDSLQIMNVMQMQENAWNSGNIDLFMEGYLKSNSVVFSGSNGPVYGWEETKKKYKQVYSQDSDLISLYNLLKDIQPKRKQVKQLIKQQKLERSSISAN